MGFDAVWISPVIENTPGGYHGYWAQNIYAPNSFFGTADDLSNLSKSLHSRDMYLMVDVVANHMGYASDPSTFVPFNQQSDFHTCNGCPSQCTITNFDPSTGYPQMEYCRLAGLWDIDTDNAAIANVQYAWIKNLTTTYNVDGLRIDTIPYVYNDFWQKFIDSAGMYAVGEIFNGDTQWVGSFQQGQGPLPGVLSYPMFFTLRQVFAQQQSMNNIQTQVQSYQQYIPDPSLVGTFIDNHDNPRFLTLRNDLVAYQAALTYVLYSEGIPIIYYGTEAALDASNGPREILWPTGYNLNSEMAQFLTTVVTFRKKAQVWQYPQIQRYSDDSFYAFTRGDTFVALTNVGNGGASQQRTITYHPYTDGTKLCNLFFPDSDCVTVENGQFQVYLANGQSKIYSPLLN